MRRYLVTELRELRCLGRGGQGEVWEVELNVSGRRLARKWVSQAALDELELLYRLRHPHIVHLEGFGEGAGGYFLLLECLAGGHLGQVRPGLHLTQLGQWMAQALRGLAFLHSRGLLHGDLKPENLLISQDGILKVADFGLAGAIGELERGGTPEFMAPERLSGHLVGPASDLYSLGLTFRRLLEQHPQLGTQLRAGPVPGSPLTRFYQFLDGLCHAQPTHRPLDAATSLQLLSEALGEASFLQESPAERLAWLRTPQLVGRSETKSQLLLQLNHPGVTRLRSAPQMGVTRLLRELSINSRYHLIEGYDRDDIRIVSAPDPLGDLPIFEGPSQDILLFDNADELSEGVRSAIITSHRWRREKVGNKGICVVVRPGSVFDLQLENEGVPSVTLPPLGVGELETWLHQVFPQRGSTLDLARGLIRVCGGAPGLVNAVLEQLTSQHQIEVGALSQSPCPGSEVLEGLDATVIQGRGLNLSGLELDNWGPGQRELAAMCVCVREPIPLSLTRTAWSHLGLAVEQLYRAMEVLRELGVLALEEPLCVSGELMRRALYQHLDPNSMLLARRALFLALTEVKELPGSEGVLARVMWARLGWELGEPAALGQLVAAGELCVSLGLARLAEELLSAGEGPEFERVMKGVRAQVLVRRGRYDEALRLVAESPEEGDVELEANILQRQGRHPEVIQRLQPLMTGTPPVQRIILLARSLGTHGDLETCFSWCRRGLELECTPRDEMALRLALGFAQLQKGDFAAAGDTYTRALWLARSSGDTERTMEGVRALAHIAEMQGHFEEAIPLAEEALQLARTSGNPIHVAIRAGQLASLQLVTHHTAMSTRATFERMAQVARVSGHAAVGAAASLQLAQLFYHLGLLEEAEREAARVAESSGSSVAHHLAAMAVLAQVAVSRKQWDHTWRLLQDVREQHPREPVNHVAFRLAIVEVECLAAQSKMEQACTQAEAAIEVAVQLQAGIEEIEARLLYASLLWGVGQQEAARSEVYRARGRMVGTGILDQVWRLEAALAQVHPGGDGVGEAFARSALTRLDKAAESLDKIYQQPYLKRPDRAELRDQLLARIEQRPAARTHPHHLERILAINRQIGHFRDLQPLLESIVDAAVDLCGAERGYVLWSAQGEDVEIAVARSRGKSLGQSRGPQFSRTLATRVLKGGTPQLIRDASQEPMLAGQPSVVAQGLRSAMCAPLCVKGQVLGALYLDHHLLVRAFDQNDLDILEAFCDQAAISVAQARVMEEVQAARLEAEHAKAQVERLNIQLAETVHQREQELVLERRLADEQRRLLANSSRFKDIIGESEIVRRLLVQMERVCAFDFPVLITGESGTGKELVARALYAGSPRASHPFIAINCGAIPETLLESELFGVEKGAYTGATESRPGLFQLADRGVLFLDEVAETSLAMQVKLLRAIQEGEVRPVGGKRIVKVNVRIIAATNRDLMTMLAERTFREDLYYRLKVITLHLPPLRERKEDLPLLCAHLLAQMPHPSGLPFRLSPDALQLMARYRWPGNIRELRAVLQSVVVFAESDRLTARDLEPLLMVPAGAPLEGGGEALADVRPIDSLERDAIRSALQVTGGNKSEAARRLGISRKTLYDKLSRQQDG